MARLNYSSSDASSSSPPADRNLLLDCAGTTDASIHGQAIQKHEYDSYDDFCMVLRDRLGMTDWEAIKGGCSNDPLKPKKFSYVSNWRNKVDTSNLTILVPPSPSFHSFDSPSSPVASIDPSRLCVTSIPPSESENYSPSSGTGQLESIYERYIYANGEVPIDLCEIYDTQFARMLDEASEAKSSSSVSISPDVSPEVYVPSPKVTSLAYTSPMKTARFRKLSSAIRWLPTRIKYTILSQAAQRASRK
ncbi:hypothetical protein F5890DRAFT_1521841 [Lentinula detonsa]|uniref:Uncharacterized protein n=1 Tax=Lentinula detonsa TaxID=2804962 RepID=A0AA38URC3_9AGAR|nr:hypothetical protein F5890DRAFT_1521841 [Lentinula detonsa]